MDAPLSRFYGFLFVLIIMLFAIAFAMGGISRNIKARAIEEAMPESFPVDYEPFQECVMTCNINEGRAGPGKLPTIVPQEASIAPGTAVQFTVLYPPLTMKDVTFALDSGHTYCSLTEEGVLFARLPGRCVVRADISTVFREKAMSIYAEVSVTSA